MKRRMRTRRGGGYEVRPFPTIRRAYVDVLREGHRHHVIRGLLEVDVTRARAAMHARQADDATSVSFTAFVVAATAMAVARTGCCTPTAGDAATWCCSTTST